MLLAIGEKLVISAPIQQRIIGLNDAAGAVHVEKLQYVKFVSGDTISPNMSLFFQGFKPSQVYFSGFRVGQFALMAEHDIHIVCAQAIEACMHTETHHIHSGDRHHLPCTATPTANLRDDVNFVAQTCQCFPQSFFREASGDAVGLGCVN